MLYLASKLQRSAGQSAAARASLDRFVGAAAGDEPALVDAHYERMVLQCRASPPPQQLSPADAAALLAALEAGAATAQVGCSKFVENTKVFLLTQVVSSGLRRRVAGPPRRRPMRRTRSLS